MNESDLFKEALMSGNTDRAREYLGRSSDIIFDNKTRPIHIACENGHINVVKLLIEMKCDMECEDYWKTRPIYIACNYGHIDIVKLLIEMKCDMECEDKDKKRPIHIACEKGHIDIVKLLIEMKCDMECEGDLKRRPIHNACDYGHIDIVKLLIEMKCDMECEDIDKKRPIHIACENGHIDIVKLLISMKCVIECEGSLKTRPIHYACSNGYVDIVKVLIESNCDLECEGYMKTRPINYACANGYIDVVKLLIENKCDIECEDQDKRRPLHFACENGHIDIVKLLIEMKCDMECEDKLKWRPIHFACTFGYIDIVKLFIEHNYNIQCEDSSNHPPIYWACVCGQNDIVELLRKESQNAESDGKRRDIIAKNMGLTCGMDCGHTGFCRESFLTCLKKGQNMTEIGHGSFGTFYKLTESVTNRQFGLKSIEIDTDSKADYKNIKSDSKDVFKEHQNDLKSATKKQTTNPKAAKHIETYINICLDRLQHENIVTFFGAIEIDNQLNIFMEYMEGGSLNDYINEHKSERSSNWKDYYGKIIEITKQILQGVSFLHRNRIIHLDIKPDNILLDRNKKVIKLSDFGVSRFLIDQLIDALDHFLPEFRKFSLTDEKRKFSAGSGECYGTLGYIAPEIRKNEEYELSADIWSVGATVYHMLKGTVPGKYSYNLKIKKPEELYYLMNKMVEIEPYGRPKADELLKEAIFCGKKEILK